MAPCDVCHGSRCSLAGLGPVALEYRSCHWPAGPARVAPACPTHGLLDLSCPSAALRVCGVPGHLAPCDRCARSVRCVPSAVSRATWLLFTGAPARCVALLGRVLGHLAPVHRVPAWLVALRVRCPGPLGSCSPVRSLGVTCCVWGILGHLAHVHRCVNLVCCFVCAVCLAVVSRPFGVLGACACAVSWPRWRLFTGVRAVCSVNVLLVVVSVFFPP